MRVAPAQLHLYCGRNASPSHLACIIDGLGGRHTLLQVREGISVNFRITYRRAAALLGFLTLLVGLTVTASASYAAAGSGWIRLGDLSATTSAVDIYVYASGDSSPQFVLPGISYGTVSGYRSVSAGGYSVKMRKAGSA